MAFYKVFYKEIKGETLTSLSAISLSDDCYVFTLYLL